MSVLPCDLPCPKCGSVDISRQFYAKGEPMKAKDYNVAASKYSRGQCWHFSSIRDHLDHVCRCCQHKWQTLPLAKSKAVKP